LKKVLPTPTTSKQPIPVAPTPTPSAEVTESPSADPSPSATPSESPSESKPVLPTPPPNLDPEKTVYVDPKKPPVIDPANFPEPPATPVIITEEPKYGDLKKNPDGTFTYITKLSDPKSTVVDEATFQYTALSGATVVVRKQFILSQEGDVPSLIQTGYGPESNGFSGSLLLISLLGSALIATEVRRSLRKGR
jgi:hypothetical protein